MSLEPQRVRLVMPRIRWGWLLVALALGLMLPGWPFKWEGRRAADAPQNVGY